MTNEEAKKNVNAYVLMNAENIPQQVVTALDIFREANNKQIPKKPELAMEDHEEYFNMRVTCRGCHKTIGSYEMEDYDKEYFIRHNQYCSLCGQRIDWSEVL